MKIKLRPLDEQVIVITGADSGIGLATARLAAERGATVVLNSRNAQALAQVADELRAGGTQVAWHAGDVADQNAMRHLAEVAVTAFGRIDTWVNNAGVSIYGEIDRTPVDDVRRLFPQAPEIQSGIQLFALLSASGAPIMLTDSRDAAVANAWAHDLETVSLH